MKLSTLILLFLCLFNWCFFGARVEARPTNQMTRIQEVFRTLMGAKPGVAARGKKSVIDPDEAMWVLEAPEDGYQQQW